MPSKYLITAAVPGDVKHRLQAAAAADGRSLSWVVRRVLNAWAETQALREDLRKPQQQ